MAGMARGSLMSRSSSAVVSRVRPGQVSNRPSACTSLGRETHTCTPTAHRSSHLIESWSLGAGPQRHMGHLHPPQVTVSCQHAEQAAKPSTPLFPAVHPAVNGMSGGRSRSVQLSRQVAVAQRWRSCCATAAYRQARPLAAPKLTAARAALAVTSTAMMQAQGIAFWTSRSMGRYCARVRWSAAADVGIAGMLSKMVYCSVVGRIWVASSA